MVPRLICFKQSKADALSQHRRYGIADLHELFSTRASKMKSIWERLYARIFANRDAAILFWMNVRTPVDVAFGHTVQD